MWNKSKDVGILPQYLALTYLFLLANTSVFLTQLEHASFSAVVFALAAQLSYSFAYLLPIILILAILNGIFSLPALAGPLQKSRLLPRWVLYGLAVILTGILQVLVFADGFIFRFYSFHINGFVWNLVCTKGGIESMGSDTSATFTFTLIIVGFFLLQTLLLVLLLKAKPLQKVCQLFLTRKRLTISVLTVLLLAGLQSFAYGLSNLYAYSPVLTASEVFPLYFPVTFKKLAKSFGIEPRKNTAFRLKVKDLNLRYPLAPLTEAAEHPQYNIVWLVAESLRADMLTPEIMPATWAFSEKAVRFENHYGGSNGTRMSLFSMFYGLYGNYWFDFLSESQGPVLMDYLLQEGYQMQMFSSAKFSYPEFDKTIFTRVPPESLYDLNDADAGLGWQNDRDKVARLLEFIEKRDRQKPFMTFMFFESPHARYYFPPESIIRQDYLENFNYATMDLQEDIDRIKNRYINSCYHLDSQYARVLNYLEENRLLDNTIVLLTGDHGEEFMEKGHWGHNSTFSEEQTRTPLVLWVPGQPHRVVSHLTCHLDIPATLLPLLGVTSPAENYSLGFDLLGPPARHYTILGDWSTLGYVDEDYKATFAFKGLSAGQKVTTRNDDRVENPDLFYNTHRPELLQIMKDLSRFSE